MDPGTERLYERLLILRCRTGDDRAFAELLGRYQPRLRLFVRKLLRDSDGVEDALQDVWLDVFRSVSRLADPTAFPAWIYRIARDRCYREIRRRRKAPLTLDDREVEATEESEPTFSPEEVQAVYERLDTLEPEQREVLLLKFVEDMSYEDMAAVARCPVGTVRSRLHYAKLALRKAMERKHP